MSQKKKDLDEILLRGVRLRARTNKPEALPSVVPDLVFRLNEVHNLEEQAKNMTNKIIKHGVNPRFVHKQKARFLREGLREILARPVKGDAHTTGDYLEVEVVNTQKGRAN